MDRLTRVCLLLAATLGAAPPLVPQAAPKSLCFRGRPADGCRWFLITESRYHFRLTPGATRDEWGDAGATFMPHYLLAEAGLMRNVSPTSAVGATIWGGYDFGYEATRLGLSARGRRWLTQRSSLEGSLGLAYSSRAHVRSVIEALGAAARVDLNLSDLVNLGLRIEWVPEGTRCPQQFARPEGCIEWIVQAVDPQRVSYVGVDRREPVRVWRVYAAAGVGSKPAVATWLAAGLLGLGAAVIGDCCSVRWGM